MSELRYTFLTDGSSDRALLPIINWSIVNHGIESAINGVWAEPSLLPARTCGLAARIKAAVDLYPCEILFIHRDCEGGTVADRRIEIETAVASAFQGINRLPHVCVVPRRMTEAWLLISETVIRKAAGNPKGAVVLDFPRLRSLEDVPDPKELLFELLRTASEQTGRKLRNLPVHRLVHRVAELIDDFSPLRTLQAFTQFEEQLLDVLNDFQE